MKYIKTPLRALLDVLWFAGVRVRRYVPWVWVVVSIVGGDRRTLGYVVMKEAL